MVFLAFSLDSVECKNSVYLCYRTLFAKRPNCYHELHEYTNVTNVFYPILTKFVSFVHL